MQTFCLFIFSHLLFISSLWLNVFVSGCFLSLLFLHLLLLLLVSGDGAGVCGACPSDVFCLMVCLCTRTGWSACVCVCTLSIHIISGWIAKPFFPLSACTYSLYLFVCLLLISNATSLVIYTIYPNFFFAGNDYIL